MIKIKPEAVQSFIADMRGQRNFHIAEARHCRNKIEAALPSQSPERLLSLVEAVARNEAEAATYNAFIPADDSPNRLLIQPEHVANRFITESLRPADALWSGTGNGLCLIVHAARLGILHQIRELIFNPTPAIKP